MKRNSVICAMGLALMLLGSCGNQRNEDACIGADKAQQLALDACGMTVEDVESVSTVQAAYNGQQCYGVDITVSGRKYHYDIDAYAGTILASGISAIAEDGLPISAGGAGADGEAGAAGTGTGADTGGSIGGAAADGSTGAGAGTAGYEAGSAVPSDGILTLEDAKAKALAHAELTADQVTFVEDRLDYEHGRQVYDLEFYTADYREYDYEIDASTGDILSFDYDAEHYVPSQPAGGEAITADEAKALALERVPGATAGDIREFEQDYEDGHTEYEGKIVYNGREYEFEIDGSGGRFLKWEEEPVKK